MKNLKKSLLCLLLVFCVFALWGCRTNTTPTEDDGSETTISEVATQDATTTETTTEDSTINWVSGPHAMDGPSVRITSYEELNLDDFDDNPNLSSEENERIKRIVTDIILYIFGFDVDFNDILAVVDDDASKEWFDRVMGSWIAQSPEEREGWTISDEIQHLRASFEDSSLEIWSIRTSFMFRWEFWDENSISVPVFIEESGTRLYNLIFEEINGELKVIGLSLE